jgi:hypothetical protein
LKQHQGDVRDGYDRDKWKKIAPVQANRLVQELSQFHGSKCGKSQVSHLTLLVHILKGYRQGLIGLYIDLTVLGCRTGAGRNAPRS